MPAYNCESYINKAIDSIVNQTYDNWELIICDDGSTDNTKNIIDSYNDPRIIKNHNEINIGNLKTTNKLISLCKGELITIQDADDWSDFERIKLQVNEFRKDHLLFLCGSQSVKINNNGKILKKSDFPLSYIDIKKVLPFEFQFTSASIMFKREIISSHEIFNVFFDRKGGVDWYFFGSMILKYKMINLKETLYFYRYNSNSITNKKPENPSNMIMGRIVVYLLEQKIKYGKDGLTDNDLLKNRFNKYYNALLDEYEIDKLLLGRQYAIRLIQHHSYLEGTKELILNFFSSPALFIKWISKKILKI
ncbi:glycosyltransferase family 2 protein [Flammeovirga yaeyamensis]|uniref:Glycosyltransferase family 2 protein n=2 Tax=Flammeovirga yaeyamensis TaxID=367791 RepID=A0AAX1N2J9_9BACT|nr:glycosyltransferase family 2 protein [Flammeovirga yaeyamensis]MBB3696337.1 glycosyltransferase involved in cell wall biosynthesis [Flammeovirga yaeyamensis]QWG00158.1 glycosyltransferase family 2 protein [Flammeovirga yaeyamensis]